MFGNHVLLGVGGKVLHNTYTHVHIRTYVPLSESRYVSTYVQQCTHGSAIVCMTIYVCIYVCTYIRMYVRMCVYICIYVCMYVCVCVSVHVCRVSMVYMKL